jgi:hypothetical protein
MFSTLPLLASNVHQANFYTPKISSPLSSTIHESLHDGNALQSATRAKFNMSSTTLRNRKQNPYSKRITKENPLIHNRGDGRETRRKLFLRKVREESEEKRWVARGGDDEVSLEYLNKVVGTAESS